MNVVRRKDKYEGRKEGEGNKERKNEQKKGTTG
jgi:hypothetical protein